MQDRNSNESEKLWKLNTRIMNIQQTNKVCARDSSNDDDKLHQNFSFSSFPFSLREIQRRVEL